MDSTRHQGNVAIVTGAGSGIGRSTAARLAAEGATVVAVDRNEQAAQATAADLPDGSARVLAMAVDVADRAQLEQMVSRSVAELGKIDVLVNCAGIYQAKSWLDVTEADWDWLMGVNLRGLFFCSQVVGRQMIAQRSGRIVNIASRAGKVGNAHAVVYGATKAGVISLTRTLALALAPHGVTVNAICPGPIDTPMGQQSVDEMIALGLTTREEHLAERTTRIPLGRVGTPDEVAALVAYLASDEVAYVTGESVNINGGSFMD
jgi:NAD(P)-dependent dehydrogenase (short-subunit alcohol dehydrogenase family)